MFWQANIVLVLVERPYNKSKLIVPILVLNIFGGFSLGWPQKVGNTFSAYSRIACWKLEIEKNVIRGRQRREGGESRINSAHV